MKEAMCCVLAFTVLSAGCAGRQANPVPTYLPGDEKLGCDAIAAEVTQINSHIEQLKPKTNKFGTNTLWATAGVLLIFPFFFMDFKDAEKIEYDAYQRRLDRLTIIAKDRGCDINTMEKAGAKPPLTEQKATDEKPNKAAEIQNNSSTPRT